MCALSENSLLYAWPTCMYLSIKRNEVHTHNVESEFVDVESEFAINPIQPIADVGVESEFAINPIQPIARWYNILA